MLLPIILYYLCIIFTVKNSCKVLGLQNNNFIAYGNSIPNSNPEFVTIEQDNLDARPLKNKEFNFIENWWIKINELKSEVHLKKIVRAIVLTVVVVMLLLMRNDIFTYVNLLLYGLFKNLKERSKICHN